MHHSGDDLRDNILAAKAGYYIYFVDRDEQIVEDRFCKECHFMWVDAHYQEVERSERPEIPHKKSLWRKLRRRP